MNSELFRDASRAHIQRMTLSELVAVLRMDTTLFARFILPSGWELPEQCQLSEVCYVRKAAVDSAGGQRVSEHCMLQLWIDQTDPDSQLTTGAFLQRLAQAFHTFPQHDVEVRIVCEGHSVSELTIRDSAAAGACIDFTLVAERSYHTEHQHESCT